MTNRRTEPTVSRRTALAGLGAGGLGLALAPRGLTAAQERPAASPVVDADGRGRVRRSTGRSSTTRSTARPMASRCCCCTAASATPRSSTTWSPVLVAAGYRVVAMDAAAAAARPGATPRSPTTQMAADAVGLLDHLGIAKTDVVGWSDGAVIALDLAIHHPERLGRVVAYGANFTPDGATPSIVPSDQLPPSSSSSRTTSGCRRSRSASRSWSRRSTRCTRSRRTTARPSCGASRCRSWSSTGRRRSSSSPSTRGGWPS